MKVGDGRPQLPGLSRTQRGRTAQLTAFSSTYFLSLSLFFYFLVFEILCSASAGIHFTERTVALSVVKHLVNAGDCVQDSGLQEQQKRLLEELAGVLLFRWRLETTSSGESGFPW